MNYANIKKNDIANGEGVRTSLFVSGCRHHCKNCFNSEAWDFSYGKEFTDETIDYIIKLCKPSHIFGLSLLGGEPFEPENQSGVLKLAKKFKETYPEKTIWCYTGFLFESIASGIVGNPEIATELLSTIDVLVDGKFVEELKSPSLLFRGSKNQRILDMKKSMKDNEPIWLDGKWEREMGNGNIYE